MREQVWQAVCADPGAATSALAAVVGRSESTVGYHLGRLRREGRVHEQIVGRERCWFPTGAGFCPVLRRAIPTLARPTARALVRRLDLTPRTAGHMADATGLPVGQVRWAARALDPTFLVERSASGQVGLRSGAERCIERALAREGCTLWGSCPVSQAWRASLERAASPGAASEESKARPPPR